MFESNVRQTYITRFMRVPKYPFSTADDMDETLAFFWHSLIKLYFEEKWKKVSGLFFREWKETSDGWIVSHVWWRNASTHEYFRGKTDQTIRKLNIPPAFIVKHKRRLGCITIWWKFGLKRFGSNTLRLSIRS